MQNLEDPAQASPKPPGTPAPQGDKTGDAHPTTATTRSRSHLVPLPGASETNQEGIPKQGTPEPVSNPEGIPMPGVPPQPDKPGAHTPGQSHSTTSTPAGPPVVPVNPEDPTPTPGSQTPGKQNEETTQGVPPRSSKPGTNTQSTSQPIKSPGATPPATPVSSKRPTPTPASPGRTQQEEEPTPGTPRSSKSGAAPTPGHDEESSTGGPPPIIPITNKGPTPTPGPPPHDDNPRPSSSPPPPDEEDKPTSSKGPKPTPTPHPPPPEEEDEPTSKKDPKPTPTPHPPPPEEEEEDEPTPKKTPKPTSNPHPPPPEESKPSSSSHPKQSSAGKPSDPGPAPADPTDEAKEESDPCVPPIKIPGTNPKVRRQAGDKDEKCDLGKEHVIFPKDGANEAETKAIFRAMSALVIPDSIYTAKAEKVGVIFWRAALTPQQAKDVLHHPHVHLVYKDCEDDCPDLNAFIERQPGAPDDLVVIGQAPGQDLGWYHDSYLFDSKAGEGAPLYVLDSGAMLNHRVR